METYFYYKQQSYLREVNLPDGISIRKRLPVPFVKGISDMQLGYRAFISHYVMTLLYRGCKRVFLEYDLLNKDNDVLCKAVLVSKVPRYPFLPVNGIHLCYCATNVKYRGLGYYTLLLNYIQNEWCNNNLYMVVEENNIPSIRGIEKSGFVRYAKGIKNTNGQFIVTQNIQNM